MTNAVTRIVVAALAALYAAAGPSAPAVAAEGGDPVIKLADGKMWLRTPDTWTRKQPKSRIVEQEFAIAASEGDKADGRLTVMRAGGTIQANIDRWIGQFTQPDGKNTKDLAKTRQIKVAGQEVHMVDLSGTYKDQAGPFAPAVERPKYRMLGAIISVKDQGNYFIKFYGPQRTIADNERKFVTMIEGLEVK
jgi:hypothetical protein